MSFNFLKKINSYFLEKGSSIEIVVIGISTQFIIWALSFFLIVFNNNNIFGKIFGFLPILILLVPLLGFYGIGIAIIHLIDEEKYTSSVIGLILNILWLLGTGVVCYFMFFVGITV